MGWKRLLVFLFSIGQILMSYFGGFEGEETFAGPIITPAGYAFAIWGVITLGCVIYGVYQLLPKQRTNKLFDQISLPLLITFTGFILWIYAATRSWLWTTVVIFVSMLISLWWAYSYILKSKQKFNWFENLLIKGTLGLYIGWATVATVINAATALNFYGYIYPDIRSITVYIIFLVVALVNSLFGLRKIEYNAYYFGTIIWAFFAVAVRTFEQNSIVLSMISLTAVGVVIIVWLKGKGFLISK